MATRLETYFCIRSVAQGRLVSAAGNVQHFRKVVLVEGAKYYGAHLGPYKTPAKEAIRGICHRISFTTRKTI